MVIFKLIKRQKPLPYAHLYDQNQLDGVTAHKSYIDAVTSQFSDKKLPKRAFRLPSSKANSPKNPAETEAPDNEQNGENNE